MLGKDFVAIGKVWIEDLFFLRHWNIPNLILNALHSTNSSKMKSCKSILWTELWPLIWWKNISSGCTPKTTSHAVYIQFIYSIHTSLSFNKHLMFVIHYGSTWDKMRPGHPPFRANIVNLNLSPVSVDWWNCALPIILHFLALLYTKTDTSYIHIFLNYRDWEIFLTHVDLYSYKSMSKPWKYMATLV